VHFIIFQSKTADLDICTDARSRRKRNISILWNVTPCNVVYIYRFYRRFGRYYYPPLQVKTKAPLFSERHWMPTRLFGVTSQEDVFKIIAVRASNLTRRSYNDRNVHKQRCNVEYWGELNLPFGMWNIYGVLNIPVFLYFFTFHLLAFSYRTDGSYIKSAVTFYRIEPLISERTVPLQSLKMK
jgi:hypothetical protein